MSFDIAFKVLIGHEGGYVNDPQDPGGETKYGISKRSYPNENIFALTLERAKFIYKRDYWDKVRGDVLPYDVAFNLFDGAVNSGVVQSIQWLQRAANSTVAPVADDGKFGPITLKAVLNSDPGSLVASFNGYRLLLLTDLSQWPRFGRGWTIRVARNLINTGKTNVL